MLFRTYYSVSATTIVALIVNAAASEEIITGTIFCDNYFEFWFNGNLVAKDPLAFAPHQAVEVEFAWDGVSDKTYAILCEDYMNPKFETGFEYVEVPIWYELKGCCYMSQETLKMDNCTVQAETECPTSCPPGKGLGSWEDSLNSDRCNATTETCYGCGPWIGDGSLLAEFSDGTKTNKEWKVFVKSFGPTDDSIDKGCSYENFAPCKVEKNSSPSTWNTPGFNDSGWDMATEFTVEETGWGRTPTYNNSTGECCGLMTQGRKPDPKCVKLPEKQCLNPKEVLCDKSGGEPCPGPKCTTVGPQCDRTEDPRMIWASDLKRAQQILFRHTVKHGSNGKTSTGGRTNVANSVYYIFVGVSLWISRT